MKALASIRSTFAGDVGTAIFSGLGIVALAWFVFLGIQSPSGLWQTLVIGVADGSIYALIALGYTMVYGIIELINFAHFNVFMVGSFVGLWLLEAMGIAYHEIEEESDVAKIKPAIEKAYADSFPVALLIGRRPLAS